MLNKKNIPIKYSRTLNSECKKYKISVQEKAFADLVAGGWKDSDAYIAVGLYNPVYSSDANMRDMNKLLSEDKYFIDYFTSAEKQWRKAKKSDIKESPKSVRISEDDIAAELTKDNQLRELIAAKKMHPEGSKEWLDIKKMIADTTQVKKDEIKDEETTVHYYIHSVATTVRYIWPMQTRKAEYDYSAFYTPIS